MGTARGIFFNWPEAKKQNKTKKNPNWPALHKNLAKKTLLNNIPVSSEVPDDRHSLKNNNNNNKRLEENLTVA